MIKETITFGLRNIRSRKLFSLINILGSAIGITSAFFITIWVINEFSFDKSTTDFKNIYLVGWSGKDGNNKWDGSPYQLGLSAVQNIPEIISATKFISADPDHKTIHVQNRAFALENGVYVDSNWFHIINYKVQKGTIAGFSNFRNRIVISESIATKYFGKQNPIGQTIVIDSSTYQVQAVIEDPATNNSFKFKIFLPVALHFKKPVGLGTQDSWKIFDWYTFIKTRPGVYSSVISSKISGLMAEVNKDGNSAGLSGSMKFILIQCAYSCFAAWKQEYCFYISFLWVY